MSQLKTNFIGWQPDQDEYSPEGLIDADNVLHDTEGYKPLNMQTVGAFSASTWYSGATLASVRSMQIRAVGAGNNRVAALAIDKATTAAIAEMSVGVEGEASAFTTVSSGTLASAGGIYCKAFSVGELESGVFLICAHWMASLAAGGSTVYSITGEVTYTITSESGGGGSGATTSLEGTNAAHTRTDYNTDVHSGVYLKQDGVEYAVGADNTSEGSTLTSWLDSGSSAGVWAYATVTSGTLEVSAGEGSWLNLNTSRKWAKKQTAFGTGTAIVSISTSDDSGGVNILETATYTLTSIKAGTSLRGANSDYSNSTAAPVYAGAYLKNDGEEYAYDASGGGGEGTSLGSWLEGGAVADYYVRRTINSGTLNHVDAGSGWLQLNTSRGFAVKQQSASTTPGQANITLDIATAATTTAIIDTQTFSLFATDIT